MESNKISEILENYRYVNKTGRAYFAAIRQLCLLHKLKKKVKNSRLLKELSLNGKRYLIDNFPKIEQYTADGARELFCLKNIRISKGIPVYYRVFSQYVDTLTKPFDTREMCGLFEKVNSSFPCPTLEDSAAFPLYMRAVLCEKIALFYTDEDNRDDSRLRLLFMCLDESLVFDREDSLVTNPVQQVLLKDAVFENSTEYTKDSYRRNLSDYAKRSGMSQLEYAKSICSNKENFTSVLADRPFGGQVYLLLHIFLSVLFTFFLCRFSIAFVLSFVPVYRCVKLILDRFFARFVLKGFTEPALELSEIPDGKGVIVTVTTLLTGRDGLVFSRLEEMYCTCGGKNVYFSLLCDLCDSNKRNDEKDSETVRKARESILSLRKKYGDVFFLFLRDREFSKSEGKYIAPERKRGAVNALCRFLCGKSDGFNENSIKPSQDICENIRYVFTLDSDTNLTLDSVKKAAGIMLHPSNAPVYDEKKGRVVKGFGILQPKMSPSLTTSGKSFFTSFMCSPGGVDFYSSAGYNQTFALFGKGVFCGKGMFDKEIYYKALCRTNEFASNTVLSHDAPEGAILRCASTNHITLTDGFPREQMSYNKRRHRWIRGDIQNLHFFRKSRKNPRGKQVANGIDYVSKYLMSENIADALLQIFSFILLLLSLAADDGTVDVLFVTTAVACYILPFVHTLFSSIRRAFFYNLSRLFYSKGVYGSIWTSFFRMFYDLSSIAQNAYLCADAVIRALYRHFLSRRHNLEWTTAAQSDAEKSDGIMGYVKKNLFSAFFGTLLIIASQNSFVKVIGLLWMALPVTSYLQGRQRCEDVSHIPKVTENSLLENLADMWLFFEDCVSEKTHFLPPDNVSTRQGVKVSRMTSPTNIGLYLASAAVAKESSLLSRDGFEKLVYNTVCTLEELPKYGGLLYNWYDIYTAQPLQPKFVSSVDEGNYLACLYVVVGALKRTEDKTPFTQKLIQKVERLISEADFSLMYNTKRKLFYIGFTVEGDGKIVYGKNCYDMLMSETRTLSYIAIAHRKVSADHAQRLSRPLISSGHYVGIASWSGTVFEYFMPCLFLPSYKNSFTDEALKFALSMNVKNAVRFEDKTLFGISESCYNELDDDGNYRYFAFGTSKLAMCVFTQQKVISPYSSYLMLESSPSLILENLVKMRDMGLYGKYGFYESCDFERKCYGEAYAVLKCFMSHHIGMSICALGNFLFDGFVRECFMNDVCNRSARELIEERIPDEVYIKKRARKYYKNLSKPVMRPPEKSEVKSKKIPKKSEEPEKKQNDVGIKITVRDGEKVILSDLCADDSFGKIIHLQEKDYELTSFDSIREPLRITVLKGIFCGKISFCAKLNTAKNIVTESGGVVFYAQDKMYFLYGFYADEKGERHNGVCSAQKDEKTGSITFNTDKEHSRKKYVLALGRAKSFDTVYGCHKRLLSDVDKLTQRAKEFYQRCIVDEKAMAKEQDVISLQQVQNGTALPFMLPVGRYDAQKTAIFALKLMYTECSLKEYLCVRLCERLYEKPDKRVSMLACRVFCAYADGLDGELLSEFLDENAESYRLVLRSMWDVEGLCADEKTIYERCLLRLESLCIRANDDAAGRTVRARLDALKE